MTNLETFLGTFTEKFEDIEIDTTFFDETLGKIVSVNKKLDVYGTKKAEGTNIVDYSTLEDFEEFKGYENTEVPKDKNYEYYRTKMIENSAAW